jgi:hypothetical protein
MNQTQKRRPQAAVFVGAESRSGAGIIEAAY